MEILSTTQQLSRSLPEDQGISSTAISEFLNTVESHNLGLHSFMLLRHGYVVSEGWWNPFNPELPHMLFSVSKSFTSTAIGFAVTEGLITLNDSVISFFPEDVPKVITDNLAKMNIRHLLMMGTGHVEDTSEVMQLSPDGNWVKTFFTFPVEKEPGTYFLYNTGATYMLSAILHKVTGQTLLEYLEPRLFAPLGIIGATWESCPRGINVGGTGLKLTTEDIAKFGQFYLQKGIWNNQRLLPEDWINEATSKQISTGEDDLHWALGYGYQFWNCYHEAYRADGAFGQFSIVLPDQDAVVVMTSGDNDTKAAVLDAVWEILVPAMKQEQLPADPVAVAKLTDQLKNLTITLPLLRSTSKLEETINGIQYETDDNGYMSSFNISFNSNGASVTIKNKLGENVFSLGRGKWSESSARILDSTENRIMARFGWTEDNILQLTLLLVETPFCINLKIIISNQTIELTQQFNVSMEGMETETLILNQIN